MQCQPEVDGTVPALEEGRVAGGLAPFWYDSRQRKHRHRLGTHPNHKADTRRLLRVLPGLVLAVIMGCHAWVVILRPGPIMWEWRKQSGSQGEGGSCAASC